MRLLTLILLGACCSCQLRADEGSAGFISDSRLEALGEQRLDDLKPDKPMIRITVLPSFEAPIMIKWLIQEPGRQSEAIIRRPEMKISEDGAVGFDGLEVDRRVTLSKGHTLALHRALDHTNFENATTGDWTPPALDGSNWVIEYSGPDSYKLLKRSNLPYDPGTLLLDEISKQRLVQEAKLSEFCTLLWSLAGVTDLLYFGDKKAQQGGAGEPATRAESDSEGGVDLQPESEGRSP